MLEDSRIDFANSTRGAKPVADHVGLQTDTTDARVELWARTHAADMSLQDEGEMTCCYARVEEHWITDPQGIAWAQFHSLAHIPVFSEKSPHAESACCAGTEARRARVPEARRRGSSCC